MKNDGRYLTPIVCSAKHLPRCSRIRWGSRSTAVKGVLETKENPGTSLAWDFGGRSIGDAHQRGQRSNYLWKTEKEGGGGGVAGWGRGLCGDSSATEAEPRGEDAQAGPERRPPPAGARGREGGGHTACFFGGPTRSWMFLPPVTGPHQTIPETMFIRPAANNRQRCLYISFQTGAPGKWAGIQKRK